MSTAAAEQIALIPEIKQRSWATAAIVLIDAAALELALLLGCIVRYYLHSIFPITLDRPQYQGLALGVLTLPLAYYWMGLYPGYGMGAVQRIRARAYATFIVFMILLVWNYAFQDHQWSRGVLLLTMFFAMILAPAFETPLRKMLIARGICGVSMVVLGAGSTGEMVVKTLKKESDLGLIPVAVLDDDPAKWGSEIHGVRVVGPLAAAEAFSKRAKVALVALPGIGAAHLSEIVQGLSFANIIIVPDLFGIQSLWTTSRDLGGVLGLELKKNLEAPGNRLLKSLLDYAIALPVFIAALPLMAAAAVWIKIANPGPVLFRQEREGPNGRRIVIFKLRTMYSDADSLLNEYLDNNPVEKINWLRFYKLKKDPRLLPHIGWFLRRFSLDELPQLWNVLRGEMSLVGPRPLPYYHLDKFPTSFRNLRASVMPGITGLWQVTVRSDGDLKVQEVEDTYYIRNWSPWLDIYILLRTFHAVLAGQGAY
jgi:Undecaprenyl-phosphate galactose phosphotransferase WbaP